MGFRCLLGHKWNGCICEKCGSTRDEGHDWDLCRGVCRKCGKTQPERHEWDGCRCIRCGKEQHEWEGNLCKRCGKEAEMLADLQDNHGYREHITVMENEIILHPFHIAVSDISKVVYHPIDKQLQGLGGWIKFVTKDNPNIPEWNGGKLDDWEVTVNGERKKGSDLILGNVFRFGCDYEQSYNYNEEEGWAKMNEKTAAIAALAEELIK